MAAIILTSIYLVYLSLICQTLVIHDSLGYEYLGKLMLKDGLIEYIKQGPAREPLYIFVMALSNYLSNAFSADPRFILKLIQIGFLVITQILAFLIMRGLRLQPLVRAAALAYIGISPVLVNSTMWIYSEIAAVPIILGIVLCAAKAWAGIYDDLGRAKQILNGACLGLTLTLGIFVKGIFEAITPLFLLPFAVLYVYCVRKKLNSLGLNALIVFICACAAFYVPVTSYKLANKALNGQFTFTNRGPYALYGNTARRAEPLTLKRTRAALIYAANPHFCTALADQSDCDFWSYKSSDFYGFEKEQQLRAEQIPPDQINSKLASLSIQLIMQHPFQYAFLTFLEFFKMFFWETAKSGQAMYPQWLEHIYNLPWFEVALVLTSALLCMAAFVFLIRACTFNRQKYLFAQGHYQAGLILFMLFMLVCFGFAHSFFFVLQRYAIPLGPLWIIAIAFTINSMLPARHK